MFKKITRSLALCTSLFAGAAIAEENVEIPPPPPIPNQANLCLPMVFQGVSCFQGKLVATFEQCRMQINDQVELKRTPDTYVMETKMTIRSVLMRRNLDEVEEMISYLRASYSAMSNPEQSPTLSSISNGEPITLMARFSMPALEQARQILEENSGMCVVSEIPELRYSDDIPRMGSPWFYISPSTP